MAAGRMLTRELGDAPLRTNRSWVAQNCPLAAFGCFGLFHMRQAQKRLICIGSGLQWLGTKD
jgi:hypothetical protein